MLLLVALAACSPAPAGGNVRVEAEDGSWSVAIPETWRPLPLAALAKVRTGGKPPARGWLVKEYSASERAIFVVWRNEGAFDRNVVPTKEQAVEGVGAGVEVIDIGGREIEGRPFWRSILQVHTDADGRTTRQVMYQASDDTETYSFQFLAHANRFEGEVAGFDAIAASIRIVGSRERREKAALQLALATGALLIATAVLVLWLMSRSHTPAQATVEPGPPPASAGNGPDSN